MKKHRSIIWWITANILVLVGALLLLLWIGQTVLLPSLYRWQKTRTVERAVTELGESFSSPRFFRLLSQTAREQSASIRVLLNDGTETHSLDYMPYSIIQDYSKEQLMQLWRKVNGEGGKHTEIYAMDSARLRRLVPSGVNAVLHVHAFDLADGRRVAVFYNSTITPIDGMMGVLRAVLWCVVAVAFALAVAVTYRVSRRITNPIIRINTQARQLKNQDYSVIFDSDSYSEVAELSDTLNATSREMARLDGLRREVMASVSHDLRTPLSMIIAYAEVMRDVPGENTAENIEMIIDEATRLSELVGNVLLTPMATQITDRLNYSFIDYAAVCRETVERYQVFSRDGRRISYDGPAHLQISADRVRILQVLYNLLNNAISHAPESEEITLKVCVNGGRVRTEVIDRGEGLSGEELGLIWKDYYSNTRDNACHTGLGLTIVRRILELHKAPYGAESSLGEGSVFWFELECYNGVE